MVKKEINYLEQEIDDPTKVSVKDAVNRVNEAQRHFDMWENELAPALKVYWAAEDELKKAKDFLAQVMCYRNIKFSEDREYEFRVIQKDNGWYDPESIPPSVLELPGAVKTVIDKKVVEQAIDRGYVNEDEVRQAWVPKLSKPSVKIKGKTGGPS